ncbi:hypothetical protein COOONC_17391 [Cooperia oncophora]
MLRRSAKEGGGKRREKERHEIQKRRIEKFDIRNIVLVFSIELKRSPRRKKKFVGLRKKESKRIPVRELEPPRLSDVAQRRQQRVGKKTRLSREIPESVQEVVRKTAKCEIVDIQELQHRIKKRTKRLRYLSDWLCWISVIVIIICMIVAFIEYYVAHLELTVQKAVAQQTSIEWKPICSNLLPIIRRQV